MRALDTVSGADHGRPIFTPLLWLWAFATVIWSLFTPPQWTFAARVLLFQPLWILRAIIHDSTWKQDLLLLLGLHSIHSLRTGAWTIRFLNVTQSIWLEDATLKVYFQVFPLLGACALLAGLIVFRGHQLAEAAKHDPESSTRIDENPLPPLLLPSRTTHSRMFPRKHSFSYSYLLVGIPIGVSGRLGNALSIDSSKKGWFDVDSADFLARTKTSDGLAEKLKSYLHSQGVGEMDYSFAYLVTAPRFLGYSFNPVSFWYLYDADTKLKYMILEVNNTFGERRMYLLRAGTEHEDVTFADESASTETKKHQTILFSNTWEKDFHVSPFNSRKGSYSLRAIDPLAAYLEDGQLKIDNTIVLRSSREHAKIVARVFSDGQASDPSRISALELGTFILNWWWVGLMTLPRILWEARKLYLGKKLSLFFRPEVTQDSTGRSYTSDEQDLEAFFRAFLTDVVEEARRPLRVIYEPPHHSDAEIVLYSPGFTYEEDHRSTLTLKILSPAFYSRFVHYAHAKEAFDRECLATDDRNRTAIVEPASLLPTLLVAMKASRNRKPKESGVESMRWSLTTRLRCPPSTPSFSPSNDPTYTVSDIRAFGSSELDAFVRAECADSNVYRRTVTKLFLAQRFGLGVPVLVSAYDLAIRSVLLVAAMVYVGRIDCFDVLRPRSHTADDVVPVSLLLVLANAAHVWALAKG